MKEHFSLESENDRPEEENKELERPYREDEKQKIKESELLEHSTARFA